MLFIEVFPRWLRNSVTLEVFIKLQRQILCQLNVGAKVCMVREREEEF